MSLSIWALSRVKRVVVTDDADEEEGLPDDQDEVSEFLDLLGQPIGRRRRGRGDDHGGRLCSDDASLQLVDLPEAGVVLRLR